MQRQPSIMIQGVASDGTVVNVAPSAGFEECVKMGDRSWYVNQSLGNYMAIQLKELGQDAAGQPDTDAKNVLYGAMHSAAESLAGIKERGAFLEKRLDHAVKRLRTKGLWADDLPALEQVCEEKGFTKARGLIQLVRCTMGEDIASVADKEPLDEPSWRMGIELALIQRDPELMSSDAMLGPRLEEHFPYICLNTLMAAHGAKLNRLLNSEDYLDEIHDMLLDRYLKNPKIVGDITAWAKDILRQNDSDVQKETERLQKALDAQDGKQKELESRLEEARKAAQPNIAAGERLKAQIAELQRKLADAEATNEKYRNALDQRDRLLSELSDRGPDTDEALSALPPDGVVFIGGHPNMIKKIKDAHPGWLFIDGGDKNFTEFRQPALVFFWDKHLAHPTWQRAMRLIGPSTARVYLKSTNPELLELEMARGWTTAKKALEGGADEAG